MAKKNQLKIGIILSYINIALGNLIPLFYTPIMLNLLGKKEYGLYKLSSSVASYLSLAAFGIGAAVTRYLIKAQTEKGKEAEENVFGLFHIIFQGISVFTCLIGGIIICNLEIFYSGALTANELREMKVLVAILTVNTAVGFSASAYTAVVTGHERFVFLQVINILSTCIAPILNLIVLYLGCESVGMVISSLVLNILIRVLYVVYVRNRLKLKPRYNNMPIYLLKEILIFSFWIFLANVVSQLYNATDTLIIGAIPILATEGVAVYNVGAVFNGMVFNLALAVSNIYVPKANKMVFAGDSNQELTNLVIKVGRFQGYIIALVCSGFIVFGKPFITWYVGKEYIEAYWVAVVMMIPSCVPLVQSVANSITQAKNMHWFRSVVYLLIAVFNVIGTYILVHGYGVVGAAVMTGIANIVGQGFIMNWYYWKKVEIDIPKFWKNILSIMWIPIFMCIVTLLIGKIIDFYRLDTMLIGIVIYTSIYIALCWKCSMNQEEKEGILEPLVKIKAKWQNK